MWNQLKRTFAFTQIVIAVLTVAVGYYSHGSWTAAATVFFTMQLGNVAGASWGARLRRRIQERAMTLPLRLR
jgi:hypothetical protein